MSLIIPLPGLFINWQEWANALAQVLEDERKFREAEVPLHGEYTEGATAFTAAYTTVQSILYGSAKVSSLAVFTGVVEIPRGAETIVNGKIEQNGVEIWKDQTLGTIPAGAGNYYLPISMSTIFQPTAADLSIVASLKCPLGGNVLRAHLYIQEERYESR